MASCKIYETNIFYISGPIIIGAGPSGIAVAACLKQNGIKSLVLERSDCLVSLWQERTYDRLKLHLPKGFCQLPLMSFPENYPKYPTRAQFISYMVKYAQHFAISPEFKKTVLKAEFDSVSGVWIVETQDCRYCSKWLVVATGENADPVMPEITGLGDFQGPVMHTCEYRSGSEFQNKKVLVIGCGNSGMEVSLDLCRNNAEAHMVVRNSVHILPREMFGVSTFQMSMTLLKWLPIKMVDRLLLAMANLTIGNTDKVGIPRPKTGPLQLKNATGKTPVLDVGAFSEIKAGNIKVKGEVQEITKYGAKFVDGDEIEYDAVILATGYKSNVPTWLKGTEFFSKQGMPKTPFPNGWKGENGLYVAGFTRRGLLGTSIDAMKIATDIAEQMDYMQPGSLEEVFWEPQSMQ